MIGCIDQESDITLYFTTEEIARLEKEVLEGAMIKWHHPKQQGLVRVAVSDEKARELRDIVGIQRDGYSCNSVGIIQIFMQHHHYEELRGRGIFGVRYGGFGSKIHFFDRNKIDIMQAGTADHLEFYRDNRDKLHPSLA